MRFFFEFVSCCGVPTQRAPEPAVPAQEEELSLVLERSAAASAASDVSSRRSCRKKVRMGGAGEWRPSLVSISEECVTPPPRERQSHRRCAVASPGRDAKKRSAGNAAAKVRRHRSYNDGHYGSAPSMPTMMPTFSATPFMF